MGTENQNTITEIRDQYLDTVLRKNPLLTRLIGLSPLLAISYSLTWSIAMGVVFLIVLTLTSLLVSVSRFLVPPPATLACYMLITATIVTAIDLLMQAWFPEVRSALGIYLPIVAANCLIIDRTLVFASQNTVLTSLKDALLHSLAVMLVLILLGSFRELIAYGSLLKDIHLIAGGVSEDFAIHFTQDNKGFFLAALPAGAFISLGLLIALGDYLSATLSTKPHRPRSIRRWGTDD